MHQKLQHRACSSSASGKPTSTASCPSISRQRYQRLSSTSCRVATFQSTTAAAVPISAEARKSFSVTSISPSMAAPTSSSSCVPEIDSADYSSFIGAEGLALVTFSTPWCGPCKLVGKELETLTKVFKKCRFAKIDLSKQDNSFAINQRIKALPTLRVYKNGRFMEELTGVKPVQMRQMLLHYSL